MEWTIDNTSPQQLVQLIPRGLFRSLLPISVWRMVHCRLVSSKGTDPANVIPHRCSSPEQVRVITRTWFSVSPRAAGVTGVSIGKERVV